MTEQKEPWQVEYELRKRAVFWGIIEAYLALTVIGVALFFVVRLVLATLG